MTGFLLASLLLTQPPTADDKAKAAERAEDVEVMRRLLNKSVGLPNDPAPANFNTVYGNPLNGGATHLLPGNASPFGGAIIQPQATPYTTYFPGQPNSPFATLNSAGTVRLADPFDGVYLKGHGVVYTLKVKAGEQYFARETRRQEGLAAFCTNCHAASPVPAEKLEPQAKSRAEVTEWDRTRDALRGVKEAPPSEPAATVEPKSMCRPGQLTEAMTAALAKNGRHLRHLAPGESVTVVVTLDGLYGPARAAAPVATNNPADLIPDSTPKGAPVTWFTPEEEKQITLGDLHMKQNKPGEAVVAYKKALARTGPGKVVIPANTDLGFVHLIGDVISQARKKLAQALIGNREFEEAKKMIDAAALVEIDNEKWTPAPAAKKAEEKAVTVPAKLVLTVKKADLDRADKLSPAEFRKLVSVETVGLPVADKKK